MPLPLLLGGLGLGAKLLGGLFGGIGEKKQAQEQQRAKDELLRQQQAGWQAGEANRAARGNAAQSLLQGLLGGRYALDPELLKGILAARPFVPGQANPDQTKGMGWGMLGGGLSTLGGIGTSAAAALPTDPGAVGGFGGAPFDPSKLPILGRPNGGGYS